MLRRMVIEDKKVYVQQIIYLKNEEEISTQFDHEFLDNYPSKEINVGDLTGQRLVEVDPTNMIYPLFREQGVEASFPYEDVVVHTVPSKYIKIDWEAIILDDNKSGRPHIAYEMDIEELIEIRDSLKNVTRIVDVEQPLVHSLYKQHGEKYYIERNFIESLSRDIEWLIELRKDAIQGFTSKYGMKYIVHTDVEWSFAYGQEPYTKDPAVDEWIDIHEIYTLADCYILRKELELLHDALTEELSMLYKEYADESDIIDTVEKLDELHLRMKQVSKVKEHYDVIRN